MYKIALVSMPFAALHLPSIALTQLRSVLRSNLNGQAQAEIYYLNHDFVEYFGLDNYIQISRSVKATVCGLGEWLFQLAAFPGWEDDASSYLNRYARSLAAERHLLQDHERLRRGVSEYLDTLIDRYALDQCSLVGFTSMFAQNTASIATARRLKERNPKTVTVMGGANCETTMGRVFARHVDVIDYVFSGPALQTFPKLVRQLIQSGGEQGDDIPGVLTRSRLERELTGGIGEIGAELDINVDIPLEYEDFLDSLDRKCPTVVPSLLFETSRGCWWGERAHCTFCGLNGTTMQYRAMAPDQALAQFDRLFRYAPRVSRFESVDNILPRKYLTTVLPHLHPPENASLFYEIKADLKEHEMRVLAESGVTEIQPGIEAMASSTLKLMKKGTTSFHNLIFLKYCLKYGVQPVWNLLIGFPGEPEEVYCKYVADLPKLIHLPPPTGVFPVRFDRFSPYHTLAKEYGLNLRPYAFYGLIYPFPQDELDNLAYFFEDQNYENLYISNTAKWISKLESLTAEWNARWGTDNGEAPELVFQWIGDTKTVRDTRSGRLVRHELDQQDLAVLECLAQPTKQSRLPEKLGGMPESEIALRMDTLREIDLVFEDDDRVLSLVVDYGRDEGYL